MKKHRWKYLALLALFAFPLPSAAGDFDGSKPMVCATIRATECTPGGGCSEVPPESLGLPRFAVIDVPQKVIHPTRDTGIKRVTAIERMESVDGKLILQGAEDGIEGIRDGLGWTIAIAVDTGELVLTASGDAVAFVVYGACTTQN